MRLIAIHIYKWDKENAMLLCNEQNLQDLWFYQRGIAKDLINFNSRLIATRTPPGNQQSIQLEQGIGFCHTWTTTDLISVTAMTDPEYPEKAAFLLINKVIMEFREQHGKGLDMISKDTEIKFPPLEAFLKDWQNPHEADKLLKIEKELCEV